MWVFIMQTLVPLADLQYSPGFAPHVGHATVRTCLSGAPSESARRSDTVRGTASMRSIRHPANLISESCYDDLCFGVFPLRVEIRPAAAGGTCVS